jgi:hypothetical protein
MVPTPPNAIDTTPPSTVNVIACCINASLSCCNDATATSGSDDTDDDDVFAAALLPVPLLFTYNCAGPVLLCTTEETEISTKKTFTKYI